MSTARATPAKKRQAKQNVERREASIELLLNAALRLFVSQGFRATNLELLDSWTWATLSWTCGASTRAWAR